MADFLSFVYTDTMRFENPYFKNPTPHAGLMKWFIQGDGWAYIGSAVLVLALAWYGLVTQRWLWITDITVTGNQYLTSDQVQEAAKQALDQKRFLLLPQQLYIFTDPKALQTDIQSHLSTQLALDHVIVTKHFPHSISIDIAERVPGYVYFVQNQSYYLDTTGVVTAQMQSNDLNPHFPRIRDHNESRQVKVGDQLVKPKVLDFISQLHDRFTEVTHLDIAEYAIEPISCQEKHYVAEKIFAEEIEDSTSDATKQEKLAILKRLNDKEITPDQGLELLAKVKQAEQPDAVNTNSAGTYIQWQSQYNKVDCNFLAVIQDVGVVTQTGFIVYFDSTLPIDPQLNTTATLVVDALKDTKQLEYIDVRFSDRAYYK